MTPVDLVNVPEVLDRLRIQLGQSFQKGLVTLILLFLNLFFKFENPFVEIDWHFELAGLVGPGGMVVFWVLLVVLLGTPSLAVRLTLALLLASCLRLLVLLRGVVHVEVCERKVHQRSNASL